MTAYTLTLLFGTLGLNGLYKTVCSNEPKYSTNAWIIGSGTFLFAAYGCVVAGGF